MKTIWLTDIHLEFVTDSEFGCLLRDLRDQNADAVLISGDIAQAPTVADYLLKIGQTLAIPIYFVLGNHDFYHGSISQVRETVTRLTCELPQLYWLNRYESIRLSSRTSLVGHDGWSDARFGDYHNSPVRLNDFHLISELTDLSREECLQELHRLGDEAADHFRIVLPEAFRTAEHVVVLTHVPPFIEACWYNGKHSDPNWLPFFSCKAVGDVLSDIMRELYNKRMTVLCGHTHGGGRSQILPNLLVLTGPAKYRYPAIQEIFEWS